MRETPTWRIPVGIIALVAAIAVYCLLVTEFIAPLMGDWHTLFQMPVYVVLGLIWLLPLKRFLIWMETGRWS